MPEDSLYRGVNEEYFYLKEKIKPPDNLTTEQIKDKDLLKKLYEEEVKRFIDAIDAGEDYE